MIRLLGFFVGSAASIGIFLLILGMPDINLSKQFVEDENSEAVSRIVEGIATDLEAIASHVMDEITDEPRGEETGEVLEFVNGHPPAETDIVELPANDAEPAGDPVTLEESPLVETPPMQPDGTAIANDLRWHAFWNPFRSRIAAEGFVGQLEKVTGLDYRVVKIKTGVYEVTFAYESDAERRNKMSLIASATGLDLPQ